MNEYEKYKLQWMLGHGYSLENLIDELQNIQNEYFWEDHERPEISFVMCQFERGLGFKSDDYGGEIWMDKYRWEKENKT